MDNFKPYYEVAADITIAAIAGSQGSLLNDPQAVANFYRTVYEQIASCVASHVMEREELGGSADGIQRDQL